MSERVFAVESYIGLQWNCNGVYPVCYLIKLGGILFTIDRNITAKSVRSFHSRFKELLRPKNDDDYLSKITELQIASILSQRVSPISFDPLVPEELIFSHERPRSPDFAIGLPSGDTFIEVTVFRFNVITVWEKSLNYIVNYLQNFLTKNNLSYVVSLDVPLFHEMGELKSKIEKNITKKLLKSDFGKISVPLSNDLLAVTWRPLPSFGNVPNTLPPGVNVAVIGNEMSRASSVEWRISSQGLNDIAEFLVKSIRNTLNLKRKQFPHEAPYLLVVRLAHERLNWDGLNQLITERIWPNRDYSWMAGLVSFAPRTGYFVSDPGDSLSLNPNPNTRHFSQDIIDIFEGKKTFIHPYK